MYWVCILFDMFAEISLSWLLTTYKNISQHTIDT